MNHDPSPFYLYGKHSITEAFKKHHPIQKIWIAQERKQKYKDLLRKAKQQGIQLQSLPLSIIEKKFQKHADLVAYIAPLSLWSLSSYFNRYSTYTFFTLLENITDINNIGSIARSAYALGCSALILTGKQIPLITPRMIEVSEGALLHLPVIREKSTLTVARFLKEKGIHLYGTSERGETILLPQVVKEPHCWCFGNEQKGISRLLWKQCNTIFRIPTRPDFPSLNVSNAASICFFLSALTLIPNQET